MGQFNVKDGKSRKIATMEGGVGYVKTVENQWSNMLASALLQKGNHGFYASDTEFMDVYKSLTSQIIDKHGADVAAKAAAFSRNVLGMRTVSEMAAAMLNNCEFSEEGGKRRFYAKYFVRPDGVGEVLSAVQAMGMKPSHGLLKGIADYLSTLSEYQVMKYQMNGKAWSLHDIINVSHAYSPVLDAFQKGELHAADTWENAIANAGSAEEREGEWKRLVEERKLGYMALLRNLNNILGCDFVDEVWVKEHLVPQIANEGKIKGSRIFPYQIYTAWKASSASDYPIIEAAMSDAFKYATANVPVFEGRSAVILDVSGSMSNSFGANSILSITEVCSVYAAALYLSDNDIDVYKFGASAKQVKMPKKFANVFKVIKALSDNDGCGHATNMTAAFDALDGHYDREFLFSDMQAMNFDRSAGKAFNEYCAKNGSSIIYSFDLGNYDNQIVSDDSKIKYITALSDKVFDIMAITESGKTLFGMMMEYDF